MNVAFERKAKKFIDRARQPLKDKIRQAVEAILADPLRHERLSGDLRGYFKYKFTVHGVYYRMIYRIEADTVIIAAVGTRENFYRNL